MKFVAWVTGNRDESRLVRMPELPVTSALTSENPAVLVQSLQEISNLHSWTYWTGCAEGLAARPSVAFRKCMPAGQYSESALLLCSA